MFDGRVGVTDVRPLVKDAVVVVLEELVGVEVVLLSPPLSLLLIGGAMFFFVLLLVKDGINAPHGDVFQWIDYIRYEGFEIAQQGTLTAGNTKPMTASPTCTANKVKFK